MSTEIAGLIQNASHKFRRLRRVHKDWTGLLFCMYSAMELFSAQPFPPAIYSSSTAEFWRLWRSGSGLLFCMYSAMELFSEIPISVLCQ